RIDRMAGPERHLKHIAVLLLEPLERTDGRLFTREPAAPRRGASVAVVVGAVQHQRAALELAGASIEQRGGDAALRHPVIRLVRAKCLPWVEPLVVSDQPDPAVAGADAGSAVVKVGG